MAHLPGILYADLWTFTYWLLCISSRWFYKYNITTTKSQKGTTMHLSVLCLGFTRPGELDIRPLGLFGLHWLRVPEQIAFRLAVLVYRCLHGMAPTYMSVDLLWVSNVSPRQRLRSATTSALVGRCTQRSTIGDRAFVAAALAVWNSLPEDVRSSTSLQLFRRRLKSELFRRSLGPRHSTWL